MDTTEMKAQIRTFVAFLIVGLILGNLVLASFNWIFVDRLPENELAPILLPIIRGAVLYIIVGVSIGFALRRGIENFQENEMLILTAGWGVSGALEWGFSPYIFNWISANGALSLLPFLFTSFVLTLVAATICAVSISIALQQALDHIKGKQRAAIISNWLLGWMIGWVIYSLYNHFVPYRITLFLQNIESLTALSGHITYVISTLVVAVVYGLAGGLIGGRAIYTQVYQTEPLSKPETTKDFKMRHTIMAVIIGVVTASIGGALRYYLAFSGVEWPGIVLPFYLCLLTPLIGGLLAWAAVALAKQIEDNWLRILVGGLAGGIITTLVFFSIPYMAQ